MPVPDIIHQVCGMQAVIESTYGTAVALTPSTDGVYPYLADGPPELPTELDYLYDGSVGRDPTTFFPAAQIAPNGRSRKFDFKTLFKGAGTTYTLSVLPPRQVDLMLRAAGFVRAFGSAAHTYTLVAAGTSYESISFGYYVAGKAHLMAGVLADWKWAADGLGVPIHTFPLTSIASLPATLALPSITYDYPSIDPPSAGGAVVNIGSYVAPRAKNAMFDLNRKIGGARARITTAGGNLGNVPMGCVPEMSMMIEQTALQTTPFHNTSGLDPYALMEAKTKVTVSALIGTANFNRHKTTLSNAQLVSVSDAEDEGVAMWNLKFRGTGTSAVVVLFD